MTGSEVCRDSARDNCADCLYDKCHEGWTAWVFIEGDGFFTA